MRGKRAAVASYAIENRDPYEAPVALWSRAYLRQQFDRSSVAMLHVKLTGSHSAHQRRDKQRRQCWVAHSGGRRRLTYRHCPRDASASPSRVNPVSACCSWALLTLVREAFNSFAASPLLSRLIPTARLCLAGKGVLEGDLREAVEGRRDVAFEIDPPRDRIHQLLRSSAVVVLLSQRRPRWREQVGLPIVEGLAHGCRIVSTSETGLASWLADHGHVVLDAAASSDDIANGIARALQESASPVTVLQALPEIDGRIQADEWLMR